MLSVRPEDLPQRESYLLTVSAIVPRPIAWVSTVNVQGEPNLAPFSFFNAVSSRPPTVMFSVGQRDGIAKDTLRNVDEVGEFVVNLVDDAHAEAMNLTSGSWEYGHNEFNIAEMEPVPSTDVRPPRVASVPVAMECVVTQIVPVRDSPNVMVIGRVVHFHVQDHLLLESGLLDAAKMRLIARLGGPDYMRTGEIFAMHRPVVEKKHG